jgi:colicin import membrane protein
MSNSEYNVVINDETVETKSKKAQAIAAGEARFNEDKSVRVSIQTGAGTEVHAFEPQGKHSKPWTRTEEHDLDLEVPAGYTVAYKRNRVGALVARADDKSNWIVITADGVTEVENTTQAREVTNELAAAYKTARAEAVEAAKAEKAEAKVKRDAEREEKRLAKEQEKAEKAAAKEAAKAEKAAQAAAAAEEATADAA